jgi:hypothetical protein
LNYFNNSRAASVAALVLLGACGKKSDAPAIATKSSTPPPPAKVAIAPSPGVAAELALNPGDTPVGLALAPKAPVAALLLRDAKGDLRVERWPIGSPKSFLMTPLPKLANWSSIASSPAPDTFYVAGFLRDKSRIIGVVNVNGAWGVQFLVESPREITRLVVSPRAYDFSGSQTYRLFYSEKVPGGGSSLRSVTQTGKGEYQVIGPKITADSAHQETGTKTLPFAVPVGFEANGSALLWQDERNCVHALSYENGWTNDRAMTELPCGGAVVVAPGGGHYLHWTAGQAGVELIGQGGARSRLAAQFTFVQAPKPAADGRGLIGVVRKGATYAIEFVPADLTGSAPNK